jgi:hypothetical protein
MIFIKIKLFGLDVLHIMSGHLWKKATKKTIAMVVAIAQTDSKELQEI